MKKFCSLDKKACGCFINFYDDKLKDDVENQKIKKVKDNLVTIICEEKHISEKAHTLVSNIISTIDELGSERISDLVSKMDGKRSKYVAEVIYDEIFSDMNFAEISEKNSEEISEENLEEDLSKSSSVRFNLKLYKKS